VVPLIARAESGETTPAPASKRGQDALEEALSRFADTGPEYYGGLANHGPMAAEALVRLDRAEAVAPWVDGYRRKLQGALDAPRPVAEAEWREALGDYRRAGDWVALFDRALREAPWTSVLQRWVPRLAPGLSAAACHGLIRAAQAARGLADRDTEGRRRELAHGLAYWAARYLALPENPGAAGRLRPSEALAQVPILPADRRGRGLIGDTLSALSSLPAFADVANLVEVDATGFLSDLTETFAGVFLAQARRGTLISFIHAVTGPSAVRLLLPHLDAGTGRVMLRYAWQVGAGMYAGFSGAPNPPADEKPLAREELIDRAVATGDEHAFKFTEACLREHAIAPKPVFLIAARRACEALA
jgi:hypothetical protein